MCRMNERAEFLQYFRSVFIKMVDRLESMTEAEVLDGLLQVNAARSIYKEEFFERIKAIQTEPRERHRVTGAGRNTLDVFAYLSSIAVFVHSVNKLRSRVGERARPVEQHVYTKHAPSLFDSLEVALNERLETLRRRPSDS
jgi:deoxyadenosine/deoxycytidine kinase